MAVDTAQFRNGLKIELDGNPFVITYFQHVKPGKGGAFVRTKVKNLLNGKVLERTFRSGEKVGEPDIQERKMQFLYRDGGDLVFMDTESYEQLSLSKEGLGDAAPWLSEGMRIHVELLDGNPIGVQLPKTVEIGVREAEPVVRGQTAAKSSKPAVLENGVSLQVPPFIEAGDRIRVDPGELRYVERSK